MFRLLHAQVADRALAAAAERRRQLGPHVPRRTCMTHTSTTPASAPIAVCSNALTELMFGPSCCPRCGGPPWSAGTRP